MTAFNRPNLLDQTLRSWRRVDGDFQVYVRCEPGNPATQRVAWDHGAVVTVNRTRLGVLSNVWHEADALFGDGCDRLVIAEDDVLVSSDVISMFQWALDRWEDDPSVLAVVATQRWWAVKDDQTHVLRRSKEFAATVWATWANRWYAVLRDGWDHDYSKNGWDWWVGGQLLKGGPYETVAPLHSRSQHIGVTGAHMTPRGFKDSQCVTFRHQFPDGEWRAE